MNRRQGDVNEPVAWLPFDSPRDTIAILENAFAPQLRLHGFSADKARSLAHLAGLKLFADGWRSSEGILHKAENPIPAPRPPHLPPPLRIAT